MSSFKEQLEDDIQQVFLNLDEFAEEIEIDGKLYKAVLDCSQAGFHTASRDSFSNIGGIGLIENSCTLYVEDKFENRPVPGQVLDINGEKWLVNDTSGSVHPEKGLLILSISREWN